MALYAQATKTSGAHNPAITSHLPEPNHGLESIHRYGHTVLWVIFAAMLFFAIAFGAASFRLPKKNRIYHYLCSLICLLAAVSYYVMASGHNGVLVPARGHHAFRELLTARYYDWAVTTPLLLLDLGLFAGLSPMDIITVIVFDELMIVTGLLGAYHPFSSKKIGLYVMSCIFLLFIYGILFINGRTAARERSDKVAKAYLLLSGFTAILWAGYPVVWMLGEGLNYLTADKEVLLYAILDAAAKPGFSILLLVFHTQLEDFDAALPAWFTEAPGSHSYSALPASD